jgi:NAD(P)-dependent dehydrogenase (short-subunit alcohol dehydrogenase family)
MNQAGADTMNPHNGRTYAVTGAASGIGAATVRYLQERGGRVIACDLGGADVVGDLTTTEGRAAVADGVARLAGGKIDAIVANAGGGPPETMLALNFFGAVATLEGLRPLLKASPAPRAVVTSSISSFAQFDPLLVEACLAGDECAATAAAGRALAAGKSPLYLYGSAKHALNRWCRRAAAEPQWAGAGIALNVIAPGVVDTPAAAPVLSHPAVSAQIASMVPMRGAYPGKPIQIAALAAWCVSAENALMTGQILFVDGGFECLARGERSW